MISAWWTDLDAPVEPHEQLLTRLTAEERARAERLHFAADRSRWIVSRAWVRRTLGEVLATDGAALEFARGQWGKPQLAGAHAGALEFNLSHSSSRALLAVTTRGAVGADIEAIRPMEDMRSIAERHFAAEEQRALFALPEVEQLAAFYRLWTRKEAYIKATGTGLGHALDRFAVDERRDAARFVHIDGDETIARGWTLWHMELPAPKSGGDCKGFAGAIACAAPGVEVRLMRSR